MTQPYDTARPRSMFGKRHYTWLANLAGYWTKSVQIELACELYKENSSFKPVRWFQSIGYDRDTAQKLHDTVIRKSSK